MGWATRGSEGELSFVRCVASAGVGHIVGGGWALPGHVSRLGIRSFPDQLYKTLVEIDPVPTICTSDAGVFPSERVLFDLKLLWV